jgi:replicative DNA helicase
MPANLRGSGVIEQEADVVCFMYREGYYLSREEPRQKGGGGCDVHGTPCRLGGLSARGGQYDGSDDGQTADGADRRGEIIFQSGSNPVYRSLRTPADHQIAALPAGSTTAVWITMS